MEKIYKVQMNSKGAPDFSTAVEIPSSDNHDWEKYSDKLWKLAYERGKASVRLQGEVDAIDRDALIDYCLKLIDVERKQGSDVMNYGQERVNQTEAIIDYIEHMPHVNAERPQGEWKHLKGDEWLCPNCGHVVWTEGSWEHPLERGKDYCEHCGAQMKRSRDELVE